MVSMQKPNRPSVLLGYRNDLAVKEIHYNRQYFVNIILPNIKNDTSLSDLSKERIERIHRMSPYDDIIFFRLGMLITKPISARTFDELMENFILSEHHVWMIIGHPASNLQRNLIQDIVWGCVSLNLPEKCIRQIVMNCSKRKLTRFIYDNKAIVIFPYFEYERLVDCLINLLNEFNGRTLDIFYCGHGSSLNGAWLLGDLYEFSAFEFCDKILAQLTVRHYPVVNLYLNSCYAVK
jgi:hypothetical protein